MTSLSFALRGVCGKQSCCGVMVHQVPGAEANPRIGLGGCGDGHWVLPGRKGV